MSHLPTPADGQPLSAAAAFAGDVDRLADRFRHLGESRLRAAAGRWPSRAAAGRELAQLFADLAAAAEAGPGACPAARPIPDDGPFAVGDQIAVTGHDLAAALATAAPDRPLPLADGGTAAPAELLERAATALREVRAAV